MANATEKTITIIVNTRAIQVPKKEALSFEEVVAFAGIELGPDVAVTVAYSRGEEKKPQGTLVAGESVKAKDGMVFDVTPTNRS
jgi:hypothetical protein